LSDATTPPALGIGQRSDRVDIEKKHRQARRSVTLVKITASAVSLNVDDVAASVRFLTGHFGFTEEMSADGFASLGRPDAGMNVVFLRRGLETLPADQRDDHAGGLILAFEVDDLEGELDRLRAEGVAITMPLRSEEWGERAFQVRDPNGVIIELLDWKAVAG
jgi:catechol 2,3-dioxygenase-like lactoylglutathione lyase family enzyme